jgi:hypothetical protein
MSRQELLSLFLVPLFSASMIAATPALAGPTPTPTATPTGHTHGSSRDLL